MDVVYVIHQFEAENEDEISLCIGDPVVVLERDDGFGDGWWQVCMKGVLSTADS
jgi:cation diffusion facilitator CzcD-associated flavoprotein CzcO